MVVISHYKGGEFRVNRIVMDKVQRSKLSGSFRIEIEQKIAKTVWLGLSNVTTSCSRSTPICVRFRIQIYVNQYHRRPNESSNCRITALLQDIRSSLRTISVIRSLRTSPVALVFSTFLLVDVL